MSHPVVTPWNPKRLEGWDIRKFVPPDVVEVINRPHAHENQEGNKPLWLIWAVVPNHSPILDTICDTPDSAVYHYGALIQTNWGHFLAGKLTAHVERIPANHRFGSSLSGVFEGGSTMKVKTPRKYRVGD